MKAVTGVLAKMQAQSSDSFVREHVMFPWHDCWPGGVFYAPLESGDLVPFLDMHGGFAGGGAQLIADGMDASAALCQPQSSLPDIGVHEFQFPVLYLWRRINAGSGGAGRMRGGQGLDLAWTPSYTPGGQEHVFVSCWQVPPSGSQGGYPGSASGFDVVSGAGADRLLAAGWVPASLDHLDAELTPLEGKQFAVPVGPGDVVHLHPGGGRGLGDPLDRDLSRVEADLTDELLDRELASEVYGVQFDALGQIDEPAVSWPALTRGGGVSGRPVEGSMTLLNGENPKTGCGRDGRCWPPPAQIPACGTTALGSCLVSGVRAAGYPLVAIAVVGRPAGRGRKRSCAEARLAACGGRCGQNRRGCSTPDSSLATAGETAARSRMELSSTGAAGLLLLVLSVSAAVADDLCWILTDERK